MLGFRGRFSLSARVSDRASLTSATEHGLLHGVMTGSIVEESHHQSVTGSDDANLNKSASAHQGINRWTGANVCLG